MSSWITHNETEEKVGDFQIHRTTLEKYTGAASCVQIPEQVEYIGREAFRDNTTIEKITIPASIKEIRKSAFCGCTNLKHITIGYVNVGPQIEENAFKGCTSLCNISLPPLTWVLKDAFYDSGLQNVEIQRRCYLDEEAFCGCWELTNVTIKSADVSIKEDTFSYCPKLTQIDAPEEWMEKYGTIVREVITKNLKEQERANSKRSGKSMPTPNIKEKELIPYSDPIRFDATGITLEDLIDVLEESVEKHGVACSLFIAEIDAGGWLSSRSYPCIVMIHPEHADDYYGICITAKENGNFTFVNTYIFGKSRQMDKEATLQSKTFSGSGTRGAVAGALRGGAVGVGFAAGSIMAGSIRGGAKLIGKGIAALTMDKEELTKEKDWYALIGMVLQDAFIGE